MNVVVRNGKKMIVRMIFGVGCMGEIVGSVDLGVVKFVGCLVLKFDGWLIYFMFFDFYDFFWRMKFIFLVDCIMF